MRTERAGVMSAFFAAPILAHALSMQSINICYLDGWMSNSFETQKDYGSRTLIMRLFGIAETVEIICRPTKWVSVNYNIF